MVTEQPDSDPESRRRFEELSARVDANRAEIDALKARANESNRRADVSEARTDDDRRRISQLETRIDVDREIIAELQADGVLSREHVSQLEEALRSSREIGAAIGIVMAYRKVSESDAFEIMRRASNHTNRRVRALADEIVRTGDVSELPGA